MPGSVEIPSSLRTTSDLLRQRVANLAFRSRGLRDRPTTITLMPQHDPQKMYRQLKALEARAWPVTQAEVNCVGVWEVKTFDHLVWVGVEDGESFMMRVGWRAGGITAKGTSLRELCCGGLLRQPAPQRDVVKLNKLTGMAAAMYADVTRFRAHLDRMAHYIGELRARGIWQFVGKGGLIVRADNWQTKMAAWREETRGTTLEQMARGPDPLTRVLPVVAQWHTPCPRCGLTLPERRSVTCALCC